ncbi:hypothetical protein NKH18_51540 [Streptomyces sp. M10(2022)]
MTISVLRRVEAAGQSPPMVTTIVLRHTSVWASAGSRLSDPAARLLRYEPGRCGLPMSCVFCGGSPVTKEHIFPQWLNEYLLPGRQQTEQARYGEGAYDKTRQSVGLDFTVKKVCASCNNGWMSQLEVASKDALAPLITRQDPDLISCGSSARSHFGPQRQR